jgi:hypothetical protein
MIITVKLVIRIVKVVVEQVLIAQIVVNGV